MPTVADNVNGLLELGGALLMFANVAAIRRDKELKGVVWYPMLFFTFWSLWNLYFYPSLDQWASFAGALLMAVANGLWLGHVWYYQKRDDGRVQSSAD